LRRPLHALPAILNPGQTGYDDITELSPGELVAVEDLFDYPMVAVNFHGPAQGHHKFTVASMVSRREGRTFSDLACGTGVQHIRTVPARMGAVCGHGWGELPESGTQLWLCRPRNEHLGRAPSWIPSRASGSSRLGPHLSSASAASRRKTSPGKVLLAG
jgi:hypothetical protein